MIKKSVSNPSLLIEIGTEELPPKALRNLGRSFAAECVRSLRNSQLIDGDTFRWFATPRRLAVWVPEVKKRQAHQAMERRGPALHAAFDGDGKPTQAAIGFARSCAVDVKTLGRLKDDKGEWLVFREKRKGETAKVLIPRCIDEAVKRLPIPKRMRWGDLDTEFVRPVHWLVVLHGSSIVRCTLLSVKSTATTRGHRFHSTKPIRIQHADEYEKTLTHGCVVADFDRRRSKIINQVERIVRKVDGNAVMEDALLDEITGIVEWPQAILGEFEKEFLEVPTEVLISSMRDHQKYIHLTNGRGRLLPYFVSISNIKSKSPTRVRTGNERVLRARLSDAQFFWETDRKQKLSERLDALSHVLFHKQLGSVKDKCERIRSLSKKIAQDLDVSVELCERAALLIKADLVTDMVGEFPELQGVMGRYYAEHDGEPPEVAAACAEHYQPRFAGDDLPATAVGKVLSMADRIDTLVGIFSTGEEPTGDKDPHALRRSALGVLRIMIEGSLDLDLKELVLTSAEVYQRDVNLTAVIDDALGGRVFGFILERLHAYYLDQGFAADEIAAVAARQPTRPLDFDRRLRAVAQFRKLGAAANLAAANKRIRNILRKSGMTIDGAIDSSLLVDRSERTLIDTLDRLDETVSKQFAGAEYYAGLTALSELREPIDNFFDEVMVMAEEKDLRNNRLALLNRVQDLFLQVADISELQIDGR